MGLFDKIKEPMFLKDSMKDEKSLKNLRGLLIQPMKMVKSKLNKK